MESRYRLFFRKAETPPMRALRNSSFALTLALAGVFLPTCSAQDAVGTTDRNPATKFKDPSVFHPPAGAKVAIIEWEDLECPFCARAFPTVHVAVKQHNVALVERDYLIHSHQWSAPAALTARYLHDRISPELATQFRREIFARQASINSRDDLARFTQDFFKRNGKQLPANVDPSGQLQREINEDIALGDKAGLTHTPTIVVASAGHWTEVADLDLLDKAIEAEQARAGRTATAARPPAHAHTARTTGK